MGRIENKVKTDDLKLICHRLNLMVKTVFFLHFGLYDKSKQKIKEQNLS